MQIDYNFKNFEPSDHLRDYANTRFEKLQKYMKRSDNAYLQINLEVEKFRQIAEAILSADDLHLSAQEETEDMYATIDLVLDKLEVQIKKLRDKQKNKRKGKNTKYENISPFIFSDMESTENEPNLVKVDDFQPKPMDVEEAIGQLEKSVYGFLVFFNADNNRVNVIYQRKNGDYGLIDPGM